MRIILGAMVGAVVALGASAQPASATVQERQCFVMEAAVYKDRVHVFCATPEMSLAVALRGSAELKAKIQKQIQDAAGKPPFYALALNDPMADKVLILANMAMAAGTMLQIDFEDDSRMNPAGCGAGDCRRIVGVRATP